MWPKFATKLNDKMMCNHLVDFENISNWTIHDKLIDL
jgi:hypothetical protein